MAARTPAVMQLHFDVVDLQICLAGRASCTSCCKSVACAGTDRCDQASCPQWVSFACILEPTGRTLLIKGTVHRDLTMVPVSINVVMLCNLNSLLEALLPVCPDHLIAQDFALLLLLYLCFAGEKKRIHLASFCVGLNREDLPARAKLSMSAAFLLCGTHILLTATA